MKRVITGVMMAFVVASTVLTGCTTNQRGGRSTGEYIDDKTITARVKDALGEDPQYKFNEVNVATFRGTVQLSGFAPTSDQKSRATEIAKRVRGVQNVDNKITVRAAAP